ncbi:unnamed protein product [Paramecium octaurelia]|uniref:Uncharacterized protein n=1 Tax=Paramecium octaurelia TaxID=43137 RepID=A0A8S1XDC7_PAROT|nr:unnamed protein product [Paramecium octaurelia]
MRNDKKEKTFTSNYQMREQPQFDKTNLKSALQKKKLNSFIRYDSIKCKNVTEILCIRNRFQFIFRMVSKKLKRLYKYNLLQDSKTLSRLTYLLTERGTLDLSKIEKNSHAHIQLGEIHESCFTKSSQPKQILSKSLAH